MTNIKDFTLSKIVTQFHQTAGVFEKHNLDYCCNGKRSLEEACNEKALPLNNIIDELKPYISEDQQGALNFSQMSASKLIGHILLRHHFYVKQSIPSIIIHLTKVAEKHGERFPFMKEVLRIFTGLQEELLFHMRKEENILFPRIKELEALSIAASEANFRPGYVSDPITVMENEHETAGEMMAVIRELTNNYTVPQGACITFTLVLAELKEFEEDLHRHVHLENSLLFPLANKMMNEIMSAA